MTIETHHGIVDDMQKDLREATSHALEQGLTHDEIRTLLEKGGWPVAEIDQALALFVVTDKPVAIPVRSPVRFAKEGYLYLMQTLSYVVSAIAFLILWFQYLNTWFPGPFTVDSYRPEATRSLIRTGLSMLIVALPVFLYVSSIIRKDEASRADAPQNTTKQAVLYLGAFVASCAAAITLMVTLYAGLSGEATLHFFLKLVAVFIACAGTVWIAKQELRTEASRASSRPYVS